MLSKALRSNPSRFALSPIRHRCVSVLAAASALAMPPVTEAARESAETAEVSFEEAALKDLAKIDRLLGENR